MGDDAVSTRRRKLFATLRKNVPLYYCTVMPRCCAAGWLADVKKPTKRVSYLLEHLEIDIDPHISSLRRDILSA